MTITDAASVVDMQDVAPGVVQVTMQDRVSKNSFSVALARGLRAAFASIDANPTYKVVILTGYDTYFASGGTQDGLLAIAEGRAKCTDMNVHSLAVDCRIPVIAAMQGHGIGAGFVFGLSADFVVLGRESVYTANFMRYGFTPGIGATYLLPKKLGPVLGYEILMAARTYRGGELEKRGIGFPVVPRADVREYADELAREIAEKPRASLIMLKDHLVAEIREQLPAVIDQELAMHDVSFRQPEVKARIRALFGR